MRFEILPSRMFIALLVAVHLLTLMTVALTNFPLYARVCMVLLLVASLVYQCYLQLSNRQSWRSFTLDERRVIITTADGAVLNGELAEQTMVIAHCVVLCARLESTRFSVCQVIFPDAMQKEAFRELRVRLKFA